eukprot:11462390-Alexandrium_andersonii.AAC.1
MGRQQVFDMDATRIQQMHITERMRTESIQNKECLGIQHVGDIKRVPGHNKGKGRGLGWGKAYVSNNHRQREGG